MTTTLVPSLVMYPVSLVWTICVSGLGFRVQGFGFRVSGFGFRVSGFRFRVLGFGFQVEGPGLRVEGSGFTASLASSCCAFFASAFTSLA